MTKILLIEDDMNILMTTLQLLQFEGYDVITATNGRQGVELARKELPDLIICDIMMPYLNGYEVLEILRQNNATSRIPFIFLTARSSMEDLRKGMGLGADDYLTKPFEIEELFSAIKTRLEKTALFSRQVEELKFAISAFIPHELRTPLSIINGYSELLSDPDMVPEASKVAEIAKEINKSSNRLERLIGNYLLYTDLKLAEFSHKKKANLLNDIHRINKEYIADWCTQKAVDADRIDDLELALGDNHIVASFRLFKKILLELLDNAIKFSRPGELITIETHIEEGQAILKVTDEGRGMTQEQISNFGAFIQFDREKYEQQGSGLGLEISRILSELHGGELSIESKKGWGTKVVVLIYWEIKNE